MKSPTWTSFIDLTLMETTFHGYRLCPKLYPTCNLWANGCGQQTGTGVAASPRELIPLPETQGLCPPLLVRGHHFPIEDSPPSLNLKAIWVFSPTSIRYIYAYILTKKKSTHTAGCEMLPFLLLIQNYD